jgi:hypothetical protein
MIKTWTYNGIDYQSEWQVRQEVFKKDRVSFGEAPDEGKVEFWAQYGVTYSERELTPEEQEAQNLAIAKRERAAKVAAITVEVDGMVFDGDEQAQSRMARAITAAETAGLESTVWVLADNTVATVTKVQLQQALAKAMIAMSELWTYPYTRGKA